MITRRVFAAAGALLGGAGRALAQAPPAPWRVPPDAEIRRKLEDAGLKPA